MGLPLQLHARGYTNAFYGSFLAANGVAVACLQLPLSQLTRRLPAGPAIAAGALLAGWGFGMLAAGTSSPVLAASLVLWTLGATVVPPLARSYVVEHAPPTARGRYLGVWALADTIGVLAAPSLGGFLFTLAPAALWLACAAAGLAAAGLVLSADRMRRGQAVSRT